MLGSAQLCWPRDNILTYRSERFPRRKVNKTAGVGSQGVSYLELSTNFHKIWTFFLNWGEAMALKIIANTARRWLKLWTGFPISGNLALGTFIKEKTVAGKFPKYRLKFPKKISLTALLVSSIVSQLSPWLTRGPLPMYLCNLKALHLIFPPLDFFPVSPHLNGGSNQIRGSMMELFLPSSAAQLLTSQDNTESAHAQVF